MRIRKEFSIGEERADLRGHSSRNQHRAVADRQHHAIGHALDRGFLQAHHAVVHARQAARTGAPARAAGCRRARRAPRAAVQRAARPSRQRFLALAEKPAPERDSARCAGPRSSRARACRAAPRARPRSPGCALSASSTTRPPRLWPTKCAGPIARARSAPGAPRAPPAAAPRPCRRRYGSGSPARSSRAASGCITTPGTHRPWDQGSTVAHLFLCGVRPAAARAFAPS